MGLDVSDLNLNINIGKKIIWQIIWYILLALRIAQNSLEIKTTAGKSW